jgi:hypothetical protein
VLYYVSFYTIRGMDIPYVLFFVRRFFLILLLSFLFRVR